MEAHILLKHRQGLEHDLELLLSGGASPSCCSREATSLQLKIQLPNLSYPSGGRSCDIPLDTATVNLPSDAASSNLGSCKHVLEGLGSCPCRAQELAQGSSQGADCSESHLPTTSYHTWMAPLSSKAPQNTKTRVCSTTLQLYASTSLGWTVTPS